ncbi:NUDIX hydrolase [uncultured Varibaculum sp.]|uniref:NUDIX hydrolase n=1 Tax=uncultured Varibaculum sp. TaxID=413896 RepID=UPI002596B9FE|nr:NUDIX hydrolase [uncultured Varibaculum sp.]
MTARPKPPHMRIVRSAGALVWRLRPEANPIPGTMIPAQRQDIQVLIVHRPRYDDWSWPKGKREPGEAIPATAVREVEEETGVPIRLGAPLTVQRYRLGARVTKEVHYWVGFPDVSPETLRARPLAPLASTKEIDKCQWVGARKAMRLLTRRGDRRLLEELLTRLAERTLYTRTLAVLRHAKATKRSHWEGTEMTRPLSRRGSSQVLRLLPALSALGINQIITSPWRRCVATVAPYATLSGTPLKTEASFTEDAYREDSSKMRSVVRGLLTESKLDAPASPLAICVHRPTIPGIIGELAPLTPNNLGRLLPQDDPYLKTAGMLLVHIADYPEPRVVDLEVFRLDP